MAIATRTVYGSAMLFSRKIGAVIRGKATPLQVMLATVLGGSLGFVPGFFLPGDLGGGFAQSPGLILMLFCLAVVVNANLGVFGLTLLVAKLLSFPLLSVSYAVGTWLLDGPASGLFMALVNGKVTAWFGLEYYATTGGVVLGLCFGSLTGYLIIRLMRGVRLRMAEKESNSERYQLYVKKWWVRLLAWLLIGESKGKATWQELVEQKRVGSPIRPLGVVASLVLLVALIIGQSFISTPLVTQGVQAGFESVNGATVDVQEASLSLLGGKLEIDGLAIADSSALDQDLFAADSLVAVIDTGELLRRRLVIDEIRSSNARSGSSRVTKGVRLSDPKPVVDPPTPSGTKTIEDYLEDYKLWRGRLEQVGDWIEGVCVGSGEPSEPTPEDIEQQRQAQEAAGLAGVVATHLWRDLPRIVIRKVDIEGLAFSMGGRKDSLDLRLRNVSDAPQKIADVMTMSLVSAADDMRFLLTGPSADGAELLFDFAVSDLSIDGLFGQLRIAGEAPVSGGTLTLTGKGGFSTSGEGISLDLPLDVIMKDTTFSFAGMKPTDVASLSLPIGLSGPLTMPRVTLDDKVLRDALLKAGKAELASFVEGQAGKLLGAELGVDLTQDPKKIVEDAKEKLKAKAKEAAQEAKKKLLEGKLPSGLRGLLPGGGK